MKRNLMLILTLVLAMSLLTGCTGTVVVVGECTCPTAGEMTEPPVEYTGSGEAVKTGLAVLTDVSKSTSAAEGKDGTVQYDVTVAAVTVDDSGVIRACKIDSVQAKMKFDATGIITSDIAAPVATKNEQGAAYGMVTYGNAIAEWDVQVAALCDYALGKTVEELRNGAIDESGWAPAGSDLATSATIYLADYVDVIEAAVNNARHMGASGGDELALVMTNTLGSSVAATAEKNGTAQLDTTMAAVTSRDGVITSCIIDAVQGKIGFDAAGTIVSDLTAPIPTKNEQGESYGMKAWGNAKAEWNEQAAGFAAYVTGKTAAQVAGIAVTEGRPSGADLSATVTIKIGDFQELIAKALG